MTEEEQRNVRYIDLLLNSYDPQRSSAKTVQYILIDFLHRQHSPMCTIVKNMQV